MVLVVATMMVALAVGLVRGGRLSNLARVAFRGTPLVVLGLGAQVLLGWLSLTAGADGVAGLPLLIVSQAALLTFFWLNRRLPGMLLAFTGFALNALVILLNGAMPVSEAALRAASSGSTGTVVPGKHRLLEAGDLLPFLADVIPIAPLRTVVSIGDVILAVGAALLVVALMRRREAAGPGQRDSPTAPADG